MPAVLKQSGLPSVSWCSRHLLWYFSKVLQPKGSSHRHRVCWWVCGRRYLEDIQPNCLRFQNDINTIPCFIVGRRSLLCYGFMVFFMGAVHLVKNEDSMKKILKFGMYGWSKHWEQEMSLYLWHYGILKNKGKKLKNLDILVFSRTKEKENHAWRHGLGLSGMIRRLRYLSFTIVGSH